MAGDSHSSTVTNIQGDAHTGTGDFNKTVNVGVPFEQYKADLAEKEKEIRQMLIEAIQGERDRTDLEKQLTQVEQLRLDEQASYAAHVKDLEARISRLDELSGQVPDKLLGEAREALSTGNNSKADQLFTQVEDQADPHIVAAAEAAFQRGKLSEEAIHYNEAFRHYQRATQLMPENPLYLETAGSMAGIVANHQKEVEWKEMALAIYLDQDGPDSTNVAKMRTALGEAWCSLGQYEKAIEYFELALASDLKIYGEDHPNVARDRNNLGSAWQALGQYEKAIGYFEQALASDLITHGEDHPKVAIYRNNLGEGWRSLDQCEKAIEYFELALASDLKTYGEDHPKVAIDRNNLGLALDQLGQHEKAIEYYEMALASDLKTFGEDHPKVAIYRNNLGESWRSLDQCEKAIEYFELALASDLKTYGDDHPFVATYRNNLGLAWNALGHPDKAIEYLELSLATIEKLLGADHPTTKMAAENVARVKAKR